MSTQADLQTEIAALAGFPVKPESQWITRVQSSSVEVIAGAILTWYPTSGLSSVTGDPMAPRRAAAQAILQVRLSDQSVNASTQLRNTIDEYQRKSGRQTSVMLWLTVAIAVLTIVQIGIAWRGARGY